MKKISSALSVVFCVLFCSAKPPGLPNENNACYMNAVLQNMLNIQPLTTILGIAESVGGQLIPQYINLVKEYDNGTVSKDTLKSFYTLVSKSFEHPIIGRMKMWQEVISDDDSSKAYLRLLLSGAKVREEKEAKKDKKVIAFLEYALAELAKRTSEITTFLKGLPDVAREKFVKDYKLDDAVKFYSRFLEELTDNTIMACPEADAIKKLFLISFEVSKQDGFSDRYLFTDVPIKNGALDLDSFFGPPESPARRITAIPPKIFVLSPLRVDDKGNKTKAVLDIPESVTLKKAYFAQYEKINSDFSYTLLGIVVHSGNNFNGGHYTARVRDFDTQLWWKCDDATISTYSLQALKNDTNVKQNAYMLFYIQTDYYKKILQETREKEKREQEKMARENLNALAQSLYELAQ